jgi:hypothetical protein
MRRLILAAGVLALALSEPAPAVVFTRPAASKGPFAGAPAGKVSSRRSERGMLVLSNVPDNRYIYELVGKKVARAQVENKDNPHARLWTVDSILLQSVPIPVPKGSLGYAEEVLAGHQQFENDHWSKGGYTEAVSARAWLTLPSGARALSWQLQAGKKVAAGSARKMLFASVLNARNAILFAASILPGVDEDRARKLLIDTVRTFQGYEPDVTRYLVPGEATALLLNDELATRSDRKAPSAVVVSPKELMLLLRLALALTPQPMFMTFVHDGHSGHVVTLEAFDEAKQRYIYWEPWGKGSFLEEDNNRAGVKAEPCPGKRKFFQISTADLQSVAQGVVTVPFSGLRPYFRGGNMEQAVREYRILKGRYPRSPEVAQVNLLKAGQILADGKEHARALNIYAVCVALHDNSARALAGIAAIYAKTGETKSALNFYADAIKTLPKDESLNAAQREQLAAAWTTARKALADKP